MSVNQSEKSSKDIDSWVIIGVPLLWCVGLTVQDLARVFLCFFVWRFLRDKNKPAPTSSRLSFPRIVCLLGFLIIAIGGSQVLRVIFGGQTLDHAIFSQVIFNLSQTGEFLCSLNRNHLNNFLADHFAPILIIPALLSRANLPANVSFIPVQILSASFALYLIYRLCRKKWSLSPLICALIALLFLCSANIRQNLTAHSQIEYLALPSLVLAYYFAWTNRPWWSVLAATSTFVCKESLMVWGCCFGIYLFLVGWRLDSTQKSPQKFLWAGATLALAGALSFFAYVWGHHWFFGKSYDYLSRLEHTSSLLNVGTLGEKFFYFFHFFIPVLGVPFLSLRAALACVPILGWFLMTLVSNADHMWTVGSHYSLLPQFCAGLAALRAFDHEKFRVKMQDARLISVLILCAFCWGLKRPASALTHAINVGTLLSSEGVHEKVPINARVMVSQSASLYLLDYKNLQALIASRPEFLAENPPRYLVVTPEEDDQIPGYLRNRLKIPAMRTKNFLVYEVF